jgi:hypothetical protein
MASNIVTPAQFVPAEHLLYTKPKVNSVGGKSIGILNSATRRSLMISTPLMLNWGVNVYEKDGGQNSYSISIQFPRDEFSNPQVDSFLNMLKDMEEKVKADAVTHSREWFGKVQTKEVVEAFWNPILKYPKNPDTGEPDLERNPTLKVKLPTWEGEFKFELFDVNNEMLIPNSDRTTPDDFIQKGSNIACILQCGGIWLANGNFGVSWKLYQGVVKQTETLSRGTCHISLSTEDKKQMGNDKTEEMAQESDENQHDVHVESDVENDESPQSSDGDGVTEPEESQDPEPEPEKPKKKRVVKKKN